MTPPDSATRDPEPVRLLLRTLGDAFLDLLNDDGAAADHQEMSKALALVTYVACLPTRSASREHLIDLLWSDLDIEPAKHALRQHLWHLRRRFGDVVLTDKKSVVRLGLGISFDRDDLLSAAERGQSERVVDLYRGDFFVGFAAPGSSEFERWADVERTRLRSVFIRCAEQLVRQWLSSGRMRDGQQLAKRVRDAEPMAQHGWRLLIEAHISGGDDLGARMEADAFDQLLKHEEMEAEPASRALIATAKRGSTRNAQETNRPFSDLVGREAEFAWLMHAWNAATDGRAVCIHIVAPAGLGKSRLLQDFRARLASLRARVVIARADAGSAGIPLSLASDLVTSLGSIPGAGGVTPDVASTLVGLAPSLASIYPAAQSGRGPVDEPHVRRAAIRDLLGAISEERPLAILIDDLHWSDRESISLLTGALGALGNQRILVVVAQRPTSGAPVFLTEAQQFTLAPLSVSAITTLIANIASLPAAAWSDTLAVELRRSTGGIPLLVVESLLLAKQRRVLDVTDGEWRCTDAQALAELLRGGGAVRQRIESLGDRERAIVLLLSIAQMALPFDVLLRASQQPEADLSAALASLERRDLVGHANEQWQMGHDEYAAAALVGLTTDDARSLHASLGHALLDGAEVSARLRQLAPNHLRLGNEWERLRTAFAEVVSDSARRGDHRSLREIAIEFLGVGARDSDAERLVEMLPLEMRVGLVTPRRKAAVVLFALAAPVAGLWFALSPIQPEKTRPDLVALIGFRDGTGGDLIRELPLFERSLQTDSALLLSYERGRNVHLRTSYDVTAPSPIDRELWITVHALADSGTTDLFLTNARDGSERRLTNSPGDDTGPVWSPDGKLIVFASARWSALGHTSLAVMNLATGSVRRLTASNAADSYALWSPDGSRIAFNRRTADAKNSVCVIAVDGVATTCHEAAAGGHSRGWLSDSALLIAVTGTPAMELIHLNTISGQRYSVGSLPGEPTLSPDGRWMLCDCRVDASGRRSLVLARSDDSTLRRRIDIEGWQASTAELMWRSPNIARHIDRMQLAKGFGDPIIGVPYQLHATAFNISGTVRDLPFATYSISDSSVASVNASGVVVGRRIGRVTAHVSAGGWRSDSLVLTIRENRRDTLVTEDWSHGIGSHWIAFGAPTPTVIRDTRGTADFTTAGDGRFHSGALSFAAYAVSAGLTLSTKISTPITLDQWQELEIALQWGVDTAKVRQWDSGAGYLWGDGRISSLASNCSFQYPAGPEGKSYPDVIRLNGVSGGQRIRAPLSLRTGRRTKLTLQLFPDGRCGVALDDVPIGITNEIAAETDRGSARVVLFGNSYRTKVLVGPLVLTRGVDTAIRWDSIASRRTKAAPQ